MECVPAQQELVFKIRQSKRDRIREMFSRNIGQQFTSAFLHAEYGSAFRTRVSELNREEGSKIRIRNKTWVENGKECSAYWSETK